MGNTEIFLDKYRQLESAIRAEYRIDSNTSPVYYLMNSPSFRSIRAELDYCREVRNLLSHTPKINQGFGVEPSKELITLLDETIHKIQNPVRARQIAIPRGSVLCKSLDDFVLPTMREMDEKVYTHVPILQNDVVCGVFSENTVLSYLVDEEIVCIDKTMRFSDLTNYLPLDKHRAESFRFASINAPIGEISELFERALKDTDRIGMVFLTSNGKPNEKLLGILTAWDIAGL